MVLSNELVGKIRDKGLTLDDVAKELSMSTKTLRSRLKKRIFNTNEIEILMELLDLKQPNSIFFAKKGARKATTNTH